MSWLNWRRQLLLQLPRHYTDVTDMTISGQPSATLQDGIVRNPKGRTDISVEILKKAREMANREHNAIVDRVPEENSLVTGTTVDLYA